MIASKNVSVIVPTLGMSPYLRQCLDHLRALTSDAPEIIVVYQGGSAPKFLADSADRLVELEGITGFSVACNQGLAIAEREFVALVNDDALVEKGWLSELLESLERAPNMAAAQGINLQLDNPDRIDGCGIAWNAFWRPVQIGRGLEAPSAIGSARAIFGVSATAALFRRDALLKVALDTQDVFDSRFISYYEDVELAIRLRRHGYGSLFVPAARAFHAGGTTGHQMPRQFRRLHYSNRYLVLAGLLGSGFWLRAPVLWVRDLWDLASSLGKGRLGTTLDILLGWFRASCLIPKFIRSRPVVAPEVPLRVRKAQSWPWT